MASGRSNDFSDSTDDEGKFLAGFTIKKIAVPHQHETRREQENHRDVDEENDQIIEGFKKTIPKQHFVTISKYTHLTDPATEDHTDLLCKVRLLVNLLEQRFQAAYIPGKNISVDKGLVKFNGRLSFKQYMPIKPDKFGIQVWLLADADMYYVVVSNLPRQKQDEQRLVYREGLGSLCCVDSP